MHSSIWTFSHQLSDYSLSPSAVLSSQVFEYVLTCLILYSLKGLYKGTYTLPKQHKRRSGIRFTVVYFFLSFLFFQFINDMWHCYVGSICGDTLQHFSISEHVDRCPFITCPPPSVRAACDQENVCLPPPDIDLCVVLTLDVFFLMLLLLLLSPSPPLNEESFCTLIKTPITSHFYKMQSEWKKSKMNWFSRLGNSLNKISFSKYLLWLSDSTQIFIEILSVFSSIVAGNSNPELLLALSAVLSHKTQQLSQSETIKH